MDVQKQTGSDQEPQVIPAENARQGRIILTSPLRRVIFFGGLIGFVLIVIALSFGSHGAAPTVR